VTKTLKKILAVPLIVLVHFFGTLEFYYDLILWIIYPSSVASSKDDGLNIIFAWAQGKDSRE
jgi:hypothetical protein